MDYDASGRHMNGQEPMKNQISDERVGFFEQLGQFFHRNMYSFLILGFALLLLQDTFGTHGVLAMRRSQKEAEEIRKDITRLDEENLRLQDRVKALKTDPAAIEKPAREVMKLARPGEVIFQTQPKPSTESQNPSAHPDGPPRRQP
jgi:cell division protein FtsB